jgi:uncharacterized repeat protein (TIGR03803 family)
MTQAESCTGWIQMKRTIGLLLLAASFAFSHGAFAQTFKVLHAFTGADGSNPEARMVQGADGNLYGTTGFGGLSGGCPDLFGCGVIFKLDAAGNFTVLHKMTPAEGGQLRGLVQAPDGFLYGIASRYGVGSPTGCGFINSCGTLFRIDGAGNFTKLHDFGTTDAANPTGGLLIGRDGLLYGTTVTSIYRADTSGNVTTLHTFTSQEGNNLNGPLVEDDQGNFYGTARQGGLSGCFLTPDPDQTCGTIFKLDAAGNVTVLHQFGTGAEFKASGELVHGADGFLHGVTAGGAFTAFGGSAFKIDTAGSYQVTHGFNTAGYGPEGMHPEAGLLAASNGALYGTNTLDGLPIFSGDVEGTVYRMSTNGAVTVLHTFTGADGATPFAGLVEGSDGNLYGTTFYGGASNKGTIFRLNPRARSTVATFAFGPNPVARGQTTTGTVTLSKPAPAGGMRVDISNTNAALVTTPQSILVPQGSTQATFVARASPSFTGSVKVWASGRDGAGPSATLRVR